MAYLSHRVDVDVILRLLRMRHEGLHEEIPQHALDVLHLLCLVRPRLNPLLRFWPCGIELEETGLASPLDELVGLCYELGAWLQEEWVFGFGGIEHAFDVVAVLEVDCGEFGGWVVCGLRRKGSRFDDWSAGEVVVEDGFAVGFEDRFGGHIGGVVGVLESGRGGGVSNCNV